MDRRHYVSKEEWDNWDDEAVEQYIRFESESLQTTEGEEHLEPIYHTKLWKKIKNITNEQIIKAWKIKIKRNNKKQKTKKFL